ncbi:Kv channel-interacting protein 4-like isoform X3 [Cylas formicarius]|uniref:Kv channel-interacting protein 4-like isoform X3 n=1 Tax=Cylas formicarius TaxID=197179 RepID=UPI0029585E7F|nr:Kv channel-interacting protein 4-like isoform X3 [Cylas formicarius]
MSEECEQERIEMGQLARGQSSKGRRKPNSCIRFFRATWAKFTEIKDRHPNDLDSLDLYYLTNSSQYAHFVFNTLDQDHSGLISFEDFVQNLSILSRGSLEEKLRWAFSLYDINGDGFITKEEMTDIVSSVYDLMGKLAEPCIDEDTVKEKVDRIFQKMDKNQDGVVTLDEFLDCCKTDKDISQSMAVFDSSI